MSFQTGERLQLQVQNKQDKNKGTLASIWYSRQPARNRAFSKRQPYQLFKVSYKATMVQFSLTGKPEQERPTRWKEAEHKKHKEVLFQEPSNISSSLSKVHIQSISGTPGLNFMVQVSML